MESPGPADSTKLPPVFGGCSCSVALARPAYTQLSAAACTRLLFCLFHLLFLTKSLKMFHFYRVTLFCYGYKSQVVTVSIKQTNCYSKSEDSVRQQNKCYSKSKFEPDIFFITTKSISCLWCFHSTQNCE